MALRPVRGQIMGSSECSFSEAGRLLRRFLVARKELITDAPDTVAQLSVVRDSLERLAVSTSGGQASKRKQPIGVASQNQGVSATSLAVDPAVTTDKSVSVGAERNRQAEQAASKGDGRRTENGPKDAGKARVSIVQAGEDSVVVEPLGGPAEQERKRKEEKRLRKEERRKRREETGGAQGGELPPEGPPAVVEIAPVSEKGAEQSEEEKRREEKRLRKEERRRRKAAAANGGVDQSGQGGGGDDGPDQLGDAGEKGEEERKRRKEEKKRAKEEARRAAFQAVPPVKHAQPPPVVAEKLPPVSAVKPLHKRPREEGEVTRSSHKKKREVLLELEEKRPREGEDERLNQKGRAQPNGVATLGVDEESERREEKRNRKEEKRRAKEAAAVGQPPGTAELGKISTGGVWTPGKRGRENAGAAELGQGNEKKQRQEGGEKLGSKRGSVEMDGVGVKEGAKKKQRKEEREKTAETGDVLAARENEEKTKRKEERKRKKEAAALLHTAEIQGQPVDTSIRESKGVPSEEEARLQKRARREEKKRKREGLDLEGAKSENGAQIGVGPSKVRGNGTITEQAGMGGEPSRRKSKGAKIS